MATESLTREGEGDWSALRQAKDYRSFLRAYLEIREISLSDLARSAGFGRGFPGDVLSGKRRITSKSLRAFGGALELPSLGRKLFRYLVALEEADIFPEVDRPALCRKIDEVRAKPWTRNRREVQEGESPEIAEVLKNPHSLAVYAAAGSPGKVATYQEIAARTLLTEREIESALRILEHAGLLKYSGGSYEPVDLHLFLKSSGASTLVVTLFEQACRLAAERAPGGMGSDRELFFTSTFCIDESRMPELKAALRASVLKFVDDAIVADGGRVARFVTAFHL